MKEVITLIKLKSEEGFRNAMKELDHTLWQEK